MYDDDDIYEWSNEDEEEYSREGYDPDDQSTWNDAEWLGSITESENEGIANMIEWGLDHQD